VVTSKFIFAIFLIVIALGLGAGIALGCGLDDRGFEYRQGAGIFFFTTVSRPALGPIQPLIQWLTRALSLQVKQLVGVRLTTYLHLALRSKNAWSYTSTSPICLHGVMLS
jgi:hypothetical protein